MKAADQPRKAAGLLGVAFDNDDGHTRLTRGKNFVLVGGSQDTHGLMQETAIKVNEHLDKRGKRLQDVSPREFRDICQDVIENIRPS
ncbi:MAG: hypothetical protein LLG00_08075 [Planctomycetaceae bacterium]|nr:hypothetical protein [Planctomycetaceae bacterium]